MDHLGDLDVVEIIILKFAIKKGSVIFWSGIDKFRTSFILNTERKFRYLLCVFSLLSASYVESQYLCFPSASQALTTTHCLLQQTPVCTHITYSTHWIKTTVDCSVSRYDVLLSEKRMSYFTFIRFVRNEVICFSLYFRFVNLRKATRNWTLNFVVHKGSSQIVIGRIYIVSYLKTTSNFMLSFSGSPVVQKINIILKTCIIKIWKRSLI